MAGAIGAANIRLGADITGLIAGMKSASAAVSSFTYKINTDLTSAYKRADTATRTFRGGLTRLGSDLQGIAKQMALIGALPSLLAAGKAYKDFAELQKLEKGLTRYGETLQNVRELAKLPNIGIFDAAKSLISLKAMKVSSDLATRSIKAFANAITDAGGSSVDLEPALINLRQFISGRHINQVDLRQLSARMPQTMDAFSSAFGTNDVEKLNEKMNSIGVDAFIEKFVSELEKIPPAGGGAAMAMEQLGDSFTFFSATIGEGLDKTFDITEVIKNLGGILDNLTTNFQALSPAAQSSLFAIGAIAVALPAVIGAVGGLIKLLPILATGFGLISGPVAAVIAVVAVAAAAIITNWDSVKKFLMESTWWNTLVGIAKGTLGVITEAFKVVLNLIQGDWGNMWKAIINIGKNAANLVVDTLAGLIKGALGLFGTFNEALGFNALGKGVSSAVKWIDGLSQKFRFDVPDSFAIAKKGVDGVKAAISGTETPTKRLGKATEDAAKANREAAWAAKEYEDKLKALSLTTLEIEDIQSKMSWKEQQKQLKETIKSYKELIGVVAGLDTKLLASRKMDFTDNSLGKLKDRASGIGQTGKNIKEKTEPDTDIKYLEGRYTKSADETLSEYKRRLHGLKEATDRSNAELSASIRAAAGDVSVSFGEMLGNLVNGQNGLQDFRTRILSILGSLLKDIGKSLIALGTAGEAFKFFKDKPGFAIAAGIALNAAGQIVTNSAQQKISTTRFAKGGFAYGEMNAIVGDNPNARFDPEMIAPYSKVDKSIRESIKDSGGGGNVFIPNVTLQGQDLVIAFERAKKSRLGLIGN